MRSELLSHSEENLVKLLSSGDSKAFEKLYEKYKEKLYRYCFSMIFDSKAAEDLVQDTFMKIWETGNLISSQMSFSAYLYTIIHNKTVSYIRRLQVEKTMIEQCKTEYSELDESAMAEIISEEYELFFKTTTESLPPMRKLVFRLSREEGLSHKEIAKKLGISVNTVQEYISESLSCFKMNLLKHPDLKVAFSKILNSRFRISSLNLKKSRKIQNTP